MISIGTFCACVIKLQEFLENQPIESREDIVSYLSSLTYISRKYESLLPDIYADFLNLRASEPFINLSLSDERLVYDIFFRIYFGKKLRKVK